MKNGGNGKVPNTTDSLDTTSNSRQDWNTEVYPDSTGILASQQAFSKSAFAKNMTDYRLEGVWPSPSELVQEEVVQFWLAESALPDLASAQVRAHQLLVVARDSNGGIAGVSTALRTHIEQLGFDCFFYRTFIGHTHRVWGRLILDILLASHRLLNQRFIQGYDSDVLGLYAELENPSLMRSLKELVWHQNGLDSVYIGRTQDGKHVRVTYFDGAQMP